MDVDCKYLFYNFLTLDVQRRLFVLAESDKSAAYIGVYDKYYLVDGKYYPQEYLVMHSSSTAGFDVYRDFNADEIIMHGLVPKIKVAFESDRYRGGSAYSREKVLKVNKLIVRNLSSPNFHPFTIRTNSFYSESATDISFYSIEVRDKFHLPNLQTLKGGTFLYKGSENVDFPSLRSLTQSGMFNVWCDAPKFPKLETIESTGNFIVGNNSVQKLAFPSLTHISFMGNMFFLCTSLKEISMPNLTEVLETPVLNSASGFFLCECPELEKIDVLKLKKVSDVNVFACNCGSYDNFDSLGVPRGIFRDTGHIAKLLQHPHRRH